MRIIICCRIDCQYSCRLVDVATTAAEDPSDLDAIHDLVEVRGSRDGLVVGPFASLSFWDHSATFTAFWRNHLPMEDHLRHPVSFADLAGRPYSASFAAYL